MDALTEGAVVAQRYRLVRLLGEGGMGAVWAATHLVTRKAVALKFLKSNGASQPEVLRRFLREARAASAVRHPNVVQVHDILQDESGLPIMVMDLLEGESLGEKLERERAIPLPELARTLLPVISAVGTAHSLGIVHRDLKPDNIFLARYADGRVEPKVLDFGIAKLNAHEGDAAQTAALTKTGSMLGTPYYMSPEQAFGEKDVDTRADVWAMGIILYECLAGQRPVDGDNFGQLLKVIMTGAITPLAQVAPQLPADVTGLVDQMLKSDRAARLASLAPAFDVLQRYTDVSAEAFSEPAAIARASLAPRSTAHGLTPSTGESASDAFARTTLASAGGGKKRTLLVVAGLAGVVALAAGGALIAMKGSRAAPPENAVAHTVEVAPAPSSTSAPVVTPVVEPVASASSAPVAAPSASAPTVHGGAPKRGAKPVAEAPPSPPPPVVTPAAKPKLPGNIPEAAPF